MRRGPEELRQAAEAFRSAQEGILGWLSDRLCFEDRCNEQSSQLCVALRRAGWRRVGTVDGVYDYYSRDTGFIMRPHTWVWVKLGGQTWFVDTTADQFHDGDERFRIRLVPEEDAETYIAQDWGHC